MGVKRIFIVLDENEYKAIVKLKAGRTWEQILKEGLEAHTNCVRFSRVGKEVFCNTVQKLREYTKEELGYNDAIRLADGMISKMLEMRADAPRTKG